MLAFNKRYVSLARRQWKHVYREGAVHTHFLRFLVVGSIAAIVHFAVLWFGVVQFDVEPILATSAGFGVAVVFSYVLNYRWTFKSDSPHTRAAAKFLVVACSGLALNGAIFGGLHRGADLHVLLSQVGATATVLFWNFFLYRHWSFHRS